jgi:hypothetical protein
LIHSYKQKQDYHHSSISETYKTKGFIKAASWQHKPRKIPSCLDPAFTYLTAQLLNLNSTSYCNFIHPFADQVSFNMSVVLFLSFLPSMLFNYKSSFHAHLFILLNRKSRFTTTVLFNSSLSLSCLAHSQANHVIVFVIPRYLSFTAVSLSYGRDKE